MRFSNYIDKLLSSNEPQKCPVLKQIVGAIFSVIREHRLIALFAVCVILGIAGALYRRLGCLPCLFFDGAQWGGYGWAILSVLIICICALVNGVAIKLTPIFNLRKQSDKSTRAQITILLSTSLSAILLLVIFLVAFGISKDSPVFIPVSILGAVLGWIYQDTLKSVAAYLYLARMDKLHIDDWIECE